MVNYDDWILMSDDEREEWAEDIRKGVEEVERNSEILDRVVESNRQDQR